MPELQSHYHKHDIDCHELADFETLGTSEDKKLVFKTTFEIK